MFQIDLSLPWNTADVLSLVVSVVLALLGFYLGWRQSRILREVTGLQSAIAELEVREKLGCVKNNLGFIKNTAAADLQSLSEHERNTIIRYSNLVVDDSLAAFPVLHFAMPKIREQFCNALRRSIETLTEQGYRDQATRLYRGADSYEAILRERGERELAQEVHSAITAVTLPR
jgi:hypothetical protein